MKINDGTFNDCISHSECRKTRFTTTFQLLGVLHHRLNGVTKQEYNWRLLYRIMYWRRKDRVSNHVSDLSMSIGNSLRQLRQHWNVHENLNICSIWLLFLSNSKFSPLIDAWHICVVFFPIWKKNPIPNVAISYRILCWIHRFRAIPFHSTLRSLLFLEMYYIILSYFGVGLLVIAGECRSPDIVTRVS